jgi:hypothetical protein
VRKVSVFLILAALPFSGTYLYLWIWREHYFPSRYEDAFQALALSIVASAGMLIAAIVYWVLAYRSRKR